MFQRNTVDNASPVSFDSDLDSVSEAESVKNVEDGDLDIDIDDYDGRNDIDVLQIKNLDTGEVFSALGLDDEGHKLNTLLGDLTTLRVTSPHTHTQTHKHESPLAQHSHESESHAGGRKGKTDDEKSYGAKKQILKGLRHLKKNVENTYLNTQSSAPSLVSVDTKAGNVPATDRLQHHEEMQHVLVRTNRKDKKGKGGTCLQGLKFIQCLKQHDGPIWCIQFSFNGMFFATAGQDGDVVVWRVMTCAEIESQALLNPSDDRKSGGQGTRSSRLSSRGSMSSIDSFVGENGSACLLPGSGGVICKSPWRIFKGHTKTVVALSWSKSQFIVSGGVDQTVRLWHVTKEVCLGVFHHKDVVSCLQFHPKDDTLFLSGSFDKKLRMWDIPKGEVIHWQSTQYLISALSFMESGAVIAGFTNGQCIFYNYSKDDGFQFNTEIDCRNRGVSLKNGKKVSGIKTVRKVFTNADETDDSGHSGTGTSKNKFGPTRSIFGKNTLRMGMVGKKSEVVREYVVVTTNDSRIRMFETDGYSCIYKFKGLTNNKMRIAADSSSISNHILCASEDKYVYLWEYDNADHSHTSSVISKIGALTTKVGTYEAFLAHDATVTAALFLPHNGLVVARGLRNSNNMSTKSTSSNIQSKADNEDKYKEETEHITKEKDKKGIFGLGKAAAPKKVVEPESNPLYGAIFVTTGADGHIHVFENHAANT